eukprot:scaffold22642_cov57-Phaeocystis_antarctica.AAC.1
MHHGQYRRQIVPLGVGGVQRVVARRAALAQQRERAALGEGGVLQHLLEAAALRHRARARAREQQPARLHGAHREAVELAILALGTRQVLDGGRVPG